MILLSAHAAEACSMTIAKDCRLLDRLAETPHGPSTPSALVSLGFKRKKH